MLRIFREARRGLIGKTKLKNYIFYALGEIILVVIGILVALNINNWNENRKKTESTRAFIKDIKIDLMYDTLVFGERIRQLNEIIEYREWALSIKNFDDVSNEEIERVFHIGYSNLELNQGTFQRMQNSDAWNVTVYRRLLKGIHHYYTFNNSYVENNNEWEQKGHDREFSFWNEQNLFEVDYPFLEEIEVFQDTIVKRQKIIELITSNEGRNHLKIGLMRDQTMKETYEYILESANMLLLEIEDVDFDIKIRRIEN